MTDILIIDGDSKVTMFLHKNDAQNFLTPKYYFWHVVPKHSPIFIEDVVKVNSKAVINIQDSDEDEEGILVWVKNCNALSQSTNFSFP